MASACSEQFMWESNQGNIIQQLHEFKFRVASQPPLQVSAPSRIVKVPQQKSIKLMKLLSKPRDIHASPSLLMIAPPSDERYRSIALDELASSHQVMTGPMTLAVPNGTSAKLAHLGPHLQTSMWTNVKQNPTFVGSAEPDPSNQLAAPAYLHQLSTLAAMAWSDCSKVTEKLRHIYEQTTSLKDFHPQQSASQQSAYFRSQSDPFNFHPRSLVAQAPVDPFQTKNNYARQKAGSFTLGSTQSRYCACAACHMTRNTQSSIKKQADMTTNLMTSHVVANGSHIKASYGATTGQARSRLKRSLSPEDASGRDLQQPMKKILRTQRYGNSMSAATTNNGALAPIGYPTPSNEYTCPPRVVSNFFFHPSLQMTSKSSTSLQSCDFVVTPVFDSTNFVQKIQPNADSRLGFNNICETRIPHVIK